MNNLFDEILYKQPSFSELYETVDTFLEEYNALDDTLKLMDEGDVKITYFLLAANYGSSHINSNFEAQWKLKLWTMIFQYGPIWSKKMEIQKALRAIDLDSDELLKSGKIIYNSANNDGGAPSTSSLEELSFINNQNTSQYLKSKIDSYDRLYDLIASDITKDYIKKFKDLFIKVLSPNSVGYITGEKEEIEGLVNNLILWWW